ncbi:uncharacterized protein APUU_20205S [Aspergillus puulaauensis]|uniref:Uncharacterized protein n=1 Tax=Aspergillus puulaauensis TaxID=1220207 RepID=A0A7R7XEW4_9EURO|nr:uncharacterized protein APUU_20205S [Aspergillus puulaauensis]BCS19773.1 hypothetical protein APUU_20205S [Aspergillus puulaauensis]
MSFPSAGRVLMNYCFDSRSPACEQLPVPNTDGHWSFCCDPQQPLVLVTSTAASQRTSSSLLLPLPSPQASFTLFLPLVASFPLPLHCLTRNQQTPPLSSIDSKFTPIDTPLARLSFRLIHPPPSDGLFARVHPIPALKQLADHPESLRIASSALLSRHLPSSPPRLDLRNISPHPTSPATVSPLSPSLIALQGQTIYFLFLFSSYRELSPRIFHPSLLA